MLVCFSCIINISSCHWRFGLSWLINSCILWRVHVLRLLIISSIWILRCPWRCWRNISSVRISRLSIRVRLLHLLLYLRLHNVLLLLGLLLLRDITRVGLLLLLVIILNLGLRLLWSLLLRESRCLIMAIWYRWRRLRRLRVFRVRILLYSRLIFWAWLVLHLLYVQLLFSLSARLHLLGSNFRRLGNHRIIQFCKRIILLRLFLNILRLA